MHTEIEIVIRQRADNGNIIGDGSRVRKIVSRTFPRRERQSIAEGFAEQMVESLRDRQ
jgi:uncharacterized protein YejL (UPF0352 family)